MAGNIIIDPSYRLPYVQTVRSVRHKKAARPGENSGAPLQNKTWAKY
jgi:hypothetical protein